MRTGNKRQYQLFQYVLERVEEWEQVGGGKKQKTWKRSRVYTRRTGWTVQGE